MKKLLLPVVGLLALLLFCACSNNYFSITRNNIESIKVDNAEYETVYLYAFRDADLDGEFYCDILNHNIHHDSYGYTYSSEKLFPGDVINVWNSCFKRSSKNGNSVTYSSVSYGATAIVDKLIDTYRIEVKETADTFIITYYEAPRFNTATNREDLEEIKKNTIEVVKSRATIIYES